MTRKLLIILGMVFCVTLVHAQDIDSKQAREEFDEFRKSMHSEFDNFRKQCMDEYAEFVRKVWEEFWGAKPIPTPKKDTVPPVIMPKEDLNLPIKGVPIVIEGVVRPILVEPQPQPIEPIEEVPMDDGMYVNFTFFGTAAKVRFDISNKFKLESVQTNDVADALKAMSQEEYDNMLIDCLALRSKLQLSDWAYLQMLKSLSNAIYGESNEATLLMAYLYMLSGYKMRLATDETKLYMLYASKHHIYEEVYYRMDGETYFGMGKLPEKLYICQATFPKEKSMSLLISTNQKFGIKYDAARDISSRRYPDMNITVSVNKNLVDFYNTYPASMLDDNFMTKWAMYANTPMDNDVKEQIYGTLKSKLTGLSQLDAANKLLNLVQTGFEYEYDNKIWGYDRAFFAEESLYYPYCDCEDRSILFTRLVRDLLGLKCILVYYPGHLASAVEFTNGDVAGDYIMLEGHKYIVADGTYINASVGRTMPEMDNATATVILLE